MVGVRRRGGGSLHRITVIIPVRCHLLAGLNAGWFAGHLRITGFSGHFNPVRFQVHPPPFRTVVPGSGKQSGPLLGEQHELAPSTSARAASGAATRTELITRDEDKAANNRTLQTTRAPANIGHAGPQVVRFSSAAAALREPVGSRYPLAASRIHGMSPAQLAGGWRWRRSSSASSTASRRSAGS